MHAPESGLPPMPPGASQRRDASGHDRIKKGIDMDEMRRKREATTVQIRKEKKEDSLQKRRDVGGGGGSSGASRSSSGGDTRTAGEGGRASSYCNADPSLKAKLDALPEDCDCCGRQTRANSSRRRRASASFCRSSATRRSPR